MVAHRRRGFDQPPQCQVLPGSQEKPSALFGAFLRES